MNPIIRTVYSADPSAHVWPGDSRLWVYASHDQPGTNSHHSMISYHVFSSDDLVNWTDYGVVLHLKDVSWAASHMWAIDAAYRHGLYYLVFCAIEKKTGMFRTGLATSAVPQGPFKDLGFIQGVEHGQDPALFVDDGGVPYLYWGSGGHCNACQLSDDLREAVPGTQVDLTSQLKWVYEGPWVHKYNGKYYLSYPGLYEGKWPERMYYAMADHPLGPYQFRGEYIPQYPGQAGTNHGSIVRYKGRWYAFHHSMRLSNASECRSLMVDELYYNGDGTIRPIVPTAEGTSAGVERPGPSRVTILLEAESGPAACGEVHDVEIATERSGYSGTGYVRGFGPSSRGISVMCQLSQPATFRLVVRYASPDADQRNRLMVNWVLLDDKNSPDPARFNKEITFPRSEHWSELEVATVTLKQGDNVIWLYGGTGGIEVDCFKLIQAD